VMDIAQGGIIICVCVALGIREIYDAPRETYLDFIAVEGLLLLSVFYFSAWTVSGQAATSDITLDEQGIAWSVFGLTWKSSSWRDVKRIVVNRRVNRPFNKIYTYYRFEGTDNRKVAGLWVGGDFKQYQNLSEMFSHLNHYIGLYGISVIDARSGSDVRVETLSLPLS
jgi:hypothetical protein